jgi:membrane-bound lytic murein transglycosylase B
MRFDEPMKLALSFSAALLVLGGLVALVTVRDAEAIRQHTEQKPLIAGKLVKVVKRVALRPEVSEFYAEQAMTFRQRMARWDRFVEEAAKRFKVPPIWIRAVMQAESGGRTMLEEGKPITSSQGAMGLMQLMPETYAEMRKAYGLGPDPYDPHDNILAAAAYLKILSAKYGYPAMFAAYNDGPGNLEDRLFGAGLLPQETRDYLRSVTLAVEKGIGKSGRNLARLTRPNGEAVMIDAATVVSVRAAFPGEYAPGVQTVVTIGKKKQGVTEPPARAKAILRAHGAAV